MQDARTRLALLIVCLVTLLGSGFVLLAGRRATPPPITISPPPPEAAAAARPIKSSLAAPRTALSLSARLYVDVAGAVRRPSLYVLPPGSRVMQAILAAGGPTREADMDAVNLAEKVADGEKVFVPKRGVTPPQSARVDAQTSAVPNHTAAEADLQRLPGVGPSMAGRILAYRQQVGRFEKIEDLMMVTGIGPKKFAKIVPFVKPD